MYILFGIVIVIAVSCILMAVAQMQDWEDDDSDD